MYITKIVSVSTTIENYLLLKFDFYAEHLLFFRLHWFFEDFVWIMFVYEVVKHL